MTMIISKADWTAAVTRNAPRGEFLVAEAVDGATLDVPPVRREGQEWSETGDVGAAWDFLTAHGGGQLLCPDPHPGVGAAIVGIVPRTSVG